MSPIVTQANGSAVPEGEHQRVPPTHRRMPQGRSNAVALALFLLCIWVVGGMVESRGDEASLDLVGIVKSTDGRTLTNASVFILTAGPRLGVGTLCPSCYADCRKSARPTGDGRFTIPSVSGSLLFRVMVVAPGFAPGFFPRTDPRTGPLDVVLSPRTANHLPARTILGRVIDAQGRPIPQAVVSVETTKIGEGTSSQPPEGTDPVAITDEAGDFALGSAGAFDGMGLSIEAKTKAPGQFSMVRPGRERRTFVLTEGASIVGRVVSAGQTVSNVVVGACGADRSMGHFVGSYTIATGAEGQFALTGLPPNHEYFVYGCMESLGRWGTLPLKKVRVGADGATLDLGDLALRPGYRLAGRVKLSNRDTLPKGTRLSVGRENAWDSRTITLEADGRFDLANLPPGETLSLWTRVAGYRDSATNASFKSLTGLRGRLDADKTNLLYLLEPGEEQIGAPPDDDSDPPNKSPLAGAELKRVRPPGWVIGGQAVDAVTGKPVPRFRVSAGRVSSATAESFFVQWLGRRGTEGTNGRYVVELPRSTEFAVVQADAEGYLPARSKPLKPGQTNHVFQMTRGNGPSGVVLGLDGRPAAGATVVHLSSFQSATLPQKGALQVHDGARMQVHDSAMNQTVTDGLGRFLFSPKYGASQVWIVTDEGFARVPAKGLTGTNEVRLERWASVHGRIVRNRHGIADETMGMQFGDGFDAGASWWVILEGTLADESGRFHLARVPPGKISLTTQKLENYLEGAYTHVPQITIQLKPGEDRHLEDLEKSEKGRFPDGTDRENPMEPWKKLFLLWLLKGVVTLMMLTLGMAAIVWLKRKRT